MKQFKKAISSLDFHFGGRFGIRRIRFYGSAAHSLSQNNRWGIRVYYESLNDKNTEGEIGGYNRYNRRAVRNASETI